MATLPLREQNARRFLGFAATAAVLGVVLNLSSDGETLPKLIAGVGIVTLVWSLHRLGRLGPDEPIVFADPEPVAPKKKRKKKRPEPDSLSPPDEPTAA